MPSLPRSTALATDRDPLRESRRHLTRTSDLSARESSGPPALVRRSRSTERASSCSGSSRSAVSIHRPTSASVFSLAFAASSSGARCRAAAGRQCGSLSCLACSQPTCIRWAATSRACVQLAAAATGDHVAVGIPVRPSGSNTLTSPSSCRRGKRRVERVPLDRRRQNRPVPFQDRRDHNAR